MLNLNMKSGNVWICLIKRRSGIQVSRLASIEIMEHLFLLPVWLHFRRRHWQPTPVLLPGESQGRGSLVGCRLWGRTESDATEATQQQQQHYSILADYCQWSGAGIPAFLVEKSDHTEFYLHRLRLDLKINPNSAMLGRQHMKGVCVCVCVSVCVCVCV